MRSMSLPTTSAIVSGVSWGLPEHGIPLIRNQQALQLRGRHLKRPKAIKYQCDWKSAGFPASYGCDAVRKQVMASKPSPEDRGDAPGKEGREVPREGQRRGDHVARDVALHLALGLLLLNRDISALLLRSTGAAEGALQPRAGQLAEGTQHVRLAGCWDGHRCHQCFCSALTSFCRMLAVETLL
jgi:hypothetical protein